MLHEILLSLSGFPSSIWKDLYIDDNAQTTQAPSPASYTSAAERDMLRVLAELAELHLKVREATAAITRSHPSPVCRATSNRIKSKHLRIFTEHVINVEASILKEDAKFVGAYKAVPLSTLVTEFQPWSRPLKWLWKTILVLQPGFPRGAPASCTAAQVCDYLHQESHTGYSDLKELSNDLLIAAQEAWMQSQTPWLLYGQLPHFGPQDFMIATPVSTRNADFTLQRALVPYFVTTDAAETVLAIGKTLNQLRSRAWSKSNQQAALSKDVCTMLLPTSLAQIKSLEFPLQSNAFATCVESINRAISEAALSHVLPANMIYDFLLLVQDYVLFRNGEFTTCLIKQADDQLQTHQAGSGAVTAVRKLGSINDLKLNDAEASLILSQTWQELSSILPDHDLEDAVRDQASSWLRLKHVESSLPISTLLPASASLIIDLPTESPLHLFVSQTDVERYRNISAYLVSLHRAESQLTKLWKTPALRRCHPTPLGPPLSATPRGQHTLRTRRGREEVRNRDMRAHWACISQALFLLSQAGSYFHGEVIESSWTQLEVWLNLQPHHQQLLSKSSSRPTTAGSFKPTSSHVSDITTGSFTHGNAFAATRKDPRLIARAHRKYLETLYDSLLLNHKSYILLLREFLTTIDHYVALFQRLQVIWQGIDLQEDEGLTNAFSNYAQEERDLKAEMRRTNANLTEQVQELVSSIREAETLRDAADMTTGVARLSITVGGVDGFEPWKAKTLDHLLMKLDSLANNERKDEFEDALVDLDDD